MRPSLFRHRAWRGSLAAYYGLLCAMRLMSVLYARRIYKGVRPAESRQAREQKVCRTCGVMLSSMSAALGGVVILLANGIGGSAYPGYLIYAVAAYTFYKLVMSVMSMIRARREQSMLAMTLRKIGHADALVSLLYLQTALLSAFTAGGEGHIRTLNMVTGLAVCLAALAIGLSLIHDAKKHTPKGADAA